MHNSVAEKRRKTDHLLNNHVIHMCPEFSWFEVHIYQRQIHFTQNSPLPAHVGRTSRNIWPTCVFLVHAATCAH